MGTVGPENGVGPLKGSDMGVAGDARLNGKKPHSAVKNGLSAGGSEWRGFINVELDPSQKSMFDDWLATGEVWDVLAEAVGKGCHVAIKANTNGGGFMASVTQRNAAHVNAGLAITARSGEAAKALFRVVYLLAVLGIDRDWTIGQAPADPDRW